MALHWLDLHPQSIVEKLGGDVVHIGTAINPRSLQALAPTGGHGIEGVRGQARTDLRQAGKDFSKTGIPACHSGAAPRIKNEALVQGPLLRGILNLPPLLAGVLELLLASGVHIGLCSGFSDAGMQDIYLCVLDAESNGVTAAPSPSSVCCLNECPPSYCSGSGAHR